MSYVFEVVQEHWWFCSGIVASLFLIAPFLSKPKTKPLPLPPGPKGLPILGNALDFPLSRPWETYTRWGKQYGDLTYINALGHSILIINSLETATELLDKRSADYSDRPDMPLAEMTGWYMTLATHHYGTTWRKHRTLYQNQFKSETVQQLQPLLLGKSHEFLRRLLDAPDDWAGHIAHIVAANIMYICYGYNIRARDDPLVEMAQTSAVEVADTILKGSQVINLIPMAKHLPSWFPGFPRRARECRRKVDVLLNVPYTAVRRQMASGEPIQSWLSGLLQEHDFKGGSTEDEEIIKAVTASAFAAVILEVLRWKPPTAIGVPHSVMRDDIYNDYFIPKDTMIFANIWGMTHDPEAFPDPDNFVPERFLAADGSLKPTDRPITFGFGRRICPGRMLALETLWIMMASMLSAFNITKAKTADGEDIDVSPDVTDTLILSRLYSEAIKESPKWDMEGIDLTV
ncbi:hypothetical protein ONZ45_g3613 [Pleurotus djamor]|nr:hypothetical protein ONZ45_g3613 [Pleurotus djamor]